VAAAWLLPAVYRDAVTASTLCGACRTACPVDIDLPAMLGQARRQRLDEGARPSPTGLRQVIRRFHTPARRTSLARWLTTSRTLVGSRSQRRWLAPWLLRWTASRDLPPAPGAPFHARWAQRQAGRSDDD
jgi:L-lactate dehydrogenase complex protein LldF